ncbi:hypothetical protein A8V42_26370 [Escherichia coli]
MDFEFTGEETPEQLEKMLEGLGDVDIDSHAQDVVTEDTTENMRMRKHRLRRAITMWHRRRMPVWSRRRT